jgi:carbon-monoxide dehydrogenase medium subunit
MQLECLTPKTINEAISLVGKYQAKAKVIAGGTDLVIQLKNKLRNPDFLIDLTRIPSLRIIDLDEKRGLKIGALATVRTLETSPLIRSKYPLISQAAGQLGSVAIRNVATIGGNLCNASPSGELSQAMMALSATIRIIGPRGERELPIEDFFQGVGLTALANDEIMAGIEAPILSPNARGAYAKHSPRGSIDLAIVNVGILLTPSDTDQSCRDVRIALGAVASTPMRARKAELLLKGEKISPRLIERVAEQAADESDPRPDTLGSVEYKKEMVRVYVARLIGRLASQMVH